MEFLEKIFGSRQTQPQIQHPVWGLLEYDGNDWIGTWYFPETGRDIDIWIYERHIELEFEFHRQFCNKLIENYKYLLPDFYYYTLKELHSVGRTDVTSNKVDSELIFDGVNIPSQKDPNQAFTMWFTCMCRGFMASIQGWSIRKFEIL